MNLSIKGVKQSLNNLCSPAKFYLGLSIFSLVIYLVNMMEHKDKMITTVGIIIQSIMVLVWTSVLNWICTMKYGVKISWFLVFLPLLIVIILLFIFYHMIDKMGLTKDDLKQMIEESKGDDDKQDYNKLDKLVEGNCSA
tara:strand:+ start:383 stop:799 length:417 start_codon:yes stop_codon:yes gene_type:complete